MPQHILWEDVERPRDGQQRSSDRQGRRACYNVSPLGLCDDGCKGLAAVLCNDPPICGLFGRDPHGPLAPAQSNYGGAKLEK